MDGWSMAGSEQDGEARAFTSIHRTARGRIFHCPEIRRVVVDFMGAYLVLRQEEFFRLQEHFRRLAGCSLSRSRLQRGERIRLRDASGEKSLLLNLPEIQELAELMAVGASRLNPVISNGIPQDA